MLSLDNTYSEDELREFEERIFRIVGRARDRLLAELKIDGLSMALHYESGRLVRGVTRGDGVRGDDVTPNVRAIKADPAAALTGEDVPERARGARRGLPARARASTPSTASGRRPRRSPSRTRATPPPAP